MSDVFKFPRLYTDNDLVIQAQISLTPAQAHYLKVVMRREPGDHVRVFNARHGEFLCSIVSLSKKNVAVSCDQRIRDQRDASPHRRVHLIFPPLPKARMDMVIEKAVELGVTDIHPIITNRADVRKINKDRIESQIIEAAEQCERLTIPCLHDLEKLPALLSGWDKTFQGTSIQWCCERDYTARKNIGSVKSDESAFLIGPAGGFDDDECQQLQSAGHVVPITLGDNVLRAETACLVCLSSCLID